MMTPASTRNYINNLSNINTEQLNKLTFLSNSVAFLVHHLTK